MDSEYILEKIGGTYTYRWGKIYTGEPAYIFYSGIQEWYYNGELNRDEDKPAYIGANGNQEWYQNGKLHRDGDKPAHIYDNLPDSEAHNYDRLYADEYLECLRKGIIELKAHVYNQEIQEWYQKICCTEMTIFPQSYGMMEEWSGSNMEKDIEMVISQQL